MMPFFLLLVPEVRAYSKSFASISEEWLLNETGGSLGILLPKSNNPSILYTAYPSWLQGT